MYIGNLTSTSQSVFFERIFRILFFVSVISASFSCRANEEKPVIIIEEKGLNRGKSAWKLRIFSEGKHAELICDDEITAFPLDEDVSFLLGKFKSQQFTSRVVGLELTDARSTLFYISGANGTDTLRFEFVDPRDDALLKSISEVRVLLEIYLEVHEIFSRIDLIDQEKLFDRSRYFNVLLSGLEKQ